jgi:TRAP-type transport system small permease protein
MSFNFSDVEEKFNDIIHSVIAFCFFIILLLTIILVILRYVFNTTLLGGNEIMEYLFIYTTALGAALAIAKKEHIKITYVVDKLPFVLRKVTDILCYLLIAFLNGVMIYYSFEWIGSVGNHYSPILHIPNWVIQMIVPISCGLAVLFCIYLIILTIIKKEETTNSEGTT